MIKLEDVTISYQQKPILKNINLSVQKGSFIHFDGSNGSGKSSLIQVLLGLKEPLRGVIRRESFTYQYLPQMMNSEIKMNFQLSELCSIECPYFEKAVMSQFWSQSSGGQRQRALIANALSQHKDLYILDEPFNHLDSNSIVLVQEHLLKLHKSGKTIILTGHQLDSSSLQRIELKSWMS